MSTVIILQFMATSILSIINVQSVMNNLVSDNKRRRSIVFFYMYIVDALLYIFVQIYYPNQFIQIVLFLGYYLFMVTAVKMNGGHSFLKTLCIICLYFLLESILQSSIYLVISEIFPKSTELLVINNITLFIDISIFIFMNISSNTLKENIFSYADSTPVSVILLILSVLFINSALISNQAVSIQPQSRPLQAGINRTLLIACMLPVLAMAALLLLNTAAGKRFESSAVMLEMQLDMRDFRLRSLEQINAEIAEFKHDYRNHLLCLHSLVDRSDYENARVYLENITGRCRIGEIVRIFSGNKAADAVISSKFSSVRALGITAEFYGCISKSISPDDISAILFNALDNAAESCRKAAGGISRQAIRLLCILDRGFQIIIVSNPCCACPPFVPDTNRRGRGCGLRIIKKTVGVYGGYVSVKHTNSMFTLTLGFPVGSQTAAAEKYTKTMY